MCKILKIILSVLSLLLFIQPVLAQSYGNDSDAFNNTLGGLGAVFYILLCCCIILVPTIFSFVMLLDAIAKSDEELPSRATWIVFLALSIFLFGFGWIAALIYFFSVKMKKDEKKPKGK